MREGDTPLIDAAWHGRAADVAALLAGGAEVNEANVFGSWPLWVACFNGPYLKGHTVVIAQLLAANADVNQANANTATSTSSRSYSLPMPK